MSNFENLIKNMLEMESFDEIRFKSIKISPDKTIYFAFKESQKIIYNKQEITYEHFIELCPERKEQNLHLDNADICILDNYKKLIEFSPSFDNYNNLK